MKVIISLLLKIATFLLASIRVIKALLWGILGLLLEFARKIPKLRGSILPFLTICRDFFNRLSGIVSRGFVSAVTFFSSFSLQKLWVQDLQVIFIFLEDMIKGGRKALCITLVFTIVSYACKLFREKDIRKREILFILTIAATESAIGLAILSAYYKLNDSSPIFFEKY
jgi:hypothetical protein